MYAAQEDAMLLRRAAFKLRQNDANFQHLYLPLGDLSDLGDITRAIRANTTVTSVSIFSEYIEDDWLTLDVWRAFRAVGQLPNLERLKFDYIGSDGDELPVFVISAIVQAATKLVRLELSCVQLTGTREQFNEFSLTLRQARSLQKVHIYASYAKLSLTAAEEEEEQDSWQYMLNACVGEIAGLENLEDVLITALDFGSLGKISSASLGLLIGTSTSLKRLVLGEFELNDEHIVAMAVALEENRTLKEISFGCDLGAEGGDALAKMLHSNQVLEMLHIHLASLDGGEEHHCALAGALRHNSVVRQFSLYGTTGSTTHKTQEAYIKMLETNYSLEELEFQDEDESLQPQIDMYLKLNACGRGQLLQSATTTRNDWISALLKIHDELDCIFFLLSLNPNMLPGTRVAANNDDDDGEEAIAGWSGMKRKR